MNLLKGYFYVPIKTNATEQNVQHESALYSKTF